MAIILLDLRPAIDIVDGSFETPGEPWAHLGDPDIRPRVEAAIRAVGRLESDSSDYPFLGTAFAVGPDLALTWAGSSDEPPADLFVKFDEGVRIPVVERIPLVDGNLGCQLLRLALPNGIAPLRLSTLPVEAFVGRAIVGRDIVVVGYPASDRRTDPAAMQRVFGGMLDVKRLLPGRVTGQDKNGALQHDSSTVGGCAGAPLVDVETGEVVGIHYAGRFLEHNLAVPVAKVAADVAVALDATSPPPPSEPTTATVGGTAIDVERPGTRHATKADNDPVTGPGPLPSDRPTVAARGWRDTLGVEWRELLAPHEFRVDTAIRAVGRMLNGSSATGWNGTAFVVGDRLALTASFVTQDFAVGSGRHVTIRDGRTPGIDFSDGLGADPGTATAAVTAVRFIHPYFHVALLELDRMPAGVTTLELAARLPANLSGRPVVLIACGIPGTLFVQPGLAHQMRELPDDSRLPVLAHDCASGGGSAGGPVIDLGTGYVIGLHTAGIRNEVGFAQPPWELARDPVLWDEALAFQPDPRPPWLGRWDVAGAGARVRPLLPPPPDERWTVDRVPIDWSLPEPRALQKLLVDTINDQIALIEAENVGLPLGRVERAQVPELLWRDLLKAAAIAGLLRRFLENIAAQPQYAGIAPLLRNYL
jgi:hypothetical protein